MIFLLKTLYVSILNIKTIKNFDPYEILEISQDSDIKTIKKAYRYQIYYFFN